MIEQLDPELTAVPQVFEEIENCVPVASAMEETDRVPVLVFDRAIVCPPELLFTD